MVPHPKGVKGTKDLVREEVRAGIPNPAWEGIGTHIEEAYVKAGGKALKKTIMETKVSDSNTDPTQIHHRQTPLRILYHQIDAAPVWYSEAYYQEMIGHPTEAAALPENENIKATCLTGLLKQVPHPQAAKDFMNFLVRPEAKEVCN